MSNKDDYLLKIGGNKMNNKTSPLKSLEGKTIAIVYIFEKEDAEGFGHFLIWKDKILTG